MRNNPWGIVVILVVLALSGCLPGPDADLPPEPGSPGATSAIGQAYKIYEGYAPPVDPFNGYLEIFTVTPEEIYPDLLTDNVFTIKSTVNPGADAYTYRKGFYYDNSGWKEYFFEGNRVADSNWIKGMGYAKLALPLSSFVGGENFVVAYSCRRVNQEWKCGCSSDKPGAQCGLWMLDTFTIMPFSLPPEPPGPGFNPTAYAKIYPHGMVMEKSEIASLTTSLSISAPENVITPSSVNAVYANGANSFSTTLDSTSRECWSDDSGTRCYSSYAGPTPTLTVITPPRTDYTITIPAGQGLDTVQIPAGNVRIVPDGTKASLLILGDIGTRSFSQVVGYVRDETREYYHTYFFDTATNSFVVPAVMTNAAAELDALVQEAQQQGGTAVLTTINGQSIYLITQEQQYTTCSEEECTLSIEIITYYMWTSGDN
ncbi:MAG: hypothetical protein AABY13_04125, partial [Nanoarchaeota archaeon]